MVIAEQRFEIGRGYIITLHPNSQADVIILQSIAANTGIASNELSEDDDLEISFPMTTGD